MTTAIIDRRELILERLVELAAEEYISARTVVRNRALLKQDVRPAIAILDGDEVARLTGDGLGRGVGGRVGMTPQLITMRPQIYFILDSRKVQNVGVGQDVNIFRMTLVRVIAQDQRLLYILGSNGSMAYMGLTTDLKSGSRLDGEALVEFAFTYLLDPT